MVRPHHVLQRVYQGDPTRGYFSVVEQTMPTPRPRPTGERITVAVGVYDNGRWCDVVTGPNEIVLVINGQYYNNGGRDYMREKQLAEYSGPGERSHGG